MNIFIPIDVNHYTAAFLLHRRNKSLICQPVKQLLLLAFFYCLYVTQMHVRLICAIKFYLLTYLLTIHVKLHQPALAVKNWRILLVQSFTARNQRIRIREKTLKFSTVISTLSPYLT